MIEHADLFVEPQRMVQREHIDQRPEPQCLGSRKGAGQEYAGAAGKPERRRMVLGEVVAVKAASFDQFDQPEPLLEEFSERNAIAVEMIENTEFKHDAPSLKKCHVMLGRLGRAAALLTGRSHLRYRSRKQQSQNNTGRNDMHKFAGVLLAGVALGLATAPGHAADTIKIG